MKVSFIGLGVQGKYLAINLADAGHDLMVYDLRAEPLAELATRGAKVAKSCREAGAHAEISCVCVLDDDQLRDAVGDLLAGVRPGSIVVSHSTVEPQTIAELAQAAKERDVEFVDAPVSGSELGARNKTMAYMVGASPEAFARCRPVFETSGTNIVHAGPSGSGIRAKLAHQLIVCVNMLSAYEGMRIGQEAGLAPEVLEKTIHAGLAQSRVADRWFKWNLGPHSRDLFSKDLRLCLKFADELKVPVPGAALAQQMLDRISDVKGATTCARQ